MLLQIPDVLTPEQAERGRQMLLEADWIDGRVTAGYQSARAKNNLQLPSDHPVARQLGEIIIQALQQNALFLAAALPLHVFPPLFNRYDAARPLAPMWTTLFARRPARLTAFALTCRRLSSSPRPRTTTAAN
jgi:predicted 2-oxoglutarate/Fe(II)-dependent dioxygenase YbiX